MTVEIQDDGGQARLRSEVSSWLQQHVPREPLPALGTSEGVRAHVAWEQRLVRAGYAAIHWPTRYGGAGLDLRAHAIFEEEYARSGAPARANLIGLRLVGPTLMHWGTDEQKERHLPAILACDELWCQGFSEPEAGSDLAGIRTRGVVDDRSIVVSGEKIWATLGPWANWMLALVRTDRGARRHDGLTLLLIDLRSDGVSRRPIVQVNGDASFAQIHLDAVRVPLHNVVGEVGSGWRLAMSVLTVERGAGTVSHALLERDLASVASMARRVGLLSDRKVRDHLVELQADVHLYRVSSLHTLSCLDADASDPVESSINKLLWSELRKRIYRLGMEIRNEAGHRLDGDSPVAEFDREYWYSRAATIYGGTSEIQRNIVAERRLGLPR